MKTHRGFLAAFTRLLSVAAACAVVLAGHGYAQLPYPMPASYYEPSGVLTAVKSPVLKQSFTFAIGGHSLGQTRFERADEDSLWDHYSKSHEFSFMLTSVCGREGGDDLYLAGMHDDGTSVIERWEFSLPPGRQALRSSSPPPIGQPMGTFSPAVQPLGGSWVPPAGGFERYPNPRRTVLYQGPLGPFTAIEVDPEGRQLLIYDQAEKALKRAQLSSTPLVFENLYSVSQHGELDQIASIEARDFGTEGRKYFLRRKFGHVFAKSEEVYGIVSDPENDGQMNSIEFFTRSEMLASPYSDWDEWTLFWRVP